VRRLSLSTANYVNALVLLGGSPELRFRIPVLLNQTFDREQLTYRVLTPLEFNVTNVTVVLGFVRPGEVLLATMSLRPGDGALQVTAALLPEHQTLNPGPLSVQRAPLALNPKPQTLKRKP